MPKVFYYVASSLDGFIATEDGSVDWLDPFQRADTDYGYSEFFAGIDALLIGRRTYEQTLSFGPSPYGDKPVLVLSSRDLPASARVEVADLSPVAALKRLEDKGASRVWLVGGGELAGSCARSGLIDSYIISIMPVFLGTGAPLLGRSGAEVRLALAGTERFGDVMQCTYRPVDA